MTDFAANLTVFHVPSVKQRIVDKITFSRIKREIALTEWAPSPLNLPERRNMGPLNFHIQPYTKFQDPSSNGS